MIRKAIYICFGIFGRFRTLAISALIFTFLLLRASYQSEAQTLFSSLLGSSGGDETNKLSIFNSLQSQWRDVFELPIFDELEEVLFDGLEKVKAKHRITEEPLFITSDGIFHIGEKAEKGLFEKEFFRIELNEDDISELSQDSAISFVHEPILDVLHA